MEWQRLDELREEVGDEAVAEVIGLFLEETDEVIDRLRADPGQPVSESDMHFLKGAALNLGFQTFAGLCAAAERSARAGQGGAVDVAAIIGSYDAARAALLTRASELGLVA